MANTFGLSSFIDVKVLPYNWGDPVEDGGWTEEQQNSFLVRYHKKMNEEKTAKEKGIVEKYNSATSAYSKCLPSLSELVDGVIYQLKKDGPPELLQSASESLFIDLPDFMAEQDQERVQLIAGIIEQPSTVMVFGASGSGKTFFIIDLMMHMANGMKWRGLDTLQGPVFYICLEGKHGISKRFKSWAEYHGIQEHSRNIKILKSNIKIDRDGARTVATSIDAYASNYGPPAVIVVDTMARALPGDADENSSKDVGSFIDECDRLKNQFGCTVIIVHHTGHADSTKKRARGSSAIKGAMDTEILIDNKKIICTKSKDIEPFHDISFELLKICGSLVMTYPTVGPIPDFNEPQSTKLTPKQTHAMKIFTENIEKYGVQVGDDRGLECDIWRIEYFKNEPEGYKYDTALKAFSRSAKELVEKGILRLHNDHYLYGQERTGQDIYGHLS